MQPQRRPGRVGVHVRAGVDHEAGVRGLHEPPEQAQEPPRGGHLPVPAQGQVERARELHADPAPQVIKSGYSTGGTKGSGAGACVVGARGQAWRAVVGTDGERSGPLS